ncbi:DUF3231 family protein [Niallia circulans]
MFFIGSSNQVGVSALGYALSITMRKDLAAVWSLFFVDVMKYGGEGFNILVERGWMEKPLNRLIGMNFTNPKYLNLEQTKWRMKNKLYYVILRIVYSSSMAADLRRKYMICLFNPPPNTPDVLH